MEKVKKLVVATVILLLTTAMLPISDVKAETQSIPSIEDPTPGYWETSEYMIGNVSVGIILPESNGTIDPSTEDWTEAEEEQITNKINYALDWWASQNPDANVSFVTEFHYRVPTSYELISHNVSDPLRVQIFNELLTYLGYPGTNPLTQLMDYINDLRERFNTDWGFVMIINDASNDSDGLYPDGVGAFAIGGGPYLQVPVKTTGALDWRVAHEMGHIFWATDEYKGGTEYRGYLNVPDVEGSGCLMDAAIGSWCLSGKPHGLNGTWGQIGWRDSDGDGIQDIVDTFPRVYLNSPEISQGRINYTGITAVTPYPNNNPYTKNPEGKRNVTINKIKNIEFRVDSGDWTPAIPTDGSFGDAIENFTFVTEELDVGEHFIEVKASNQWGNSGYANDTVTISEVIHDIAIIDVKLDKTVIGQNQSVSIDVTTENQGEVSETFNLTAYANETIIDKEEVTLTNGTSTIITFTWNTTGFSLGDYTIKAIADQVPGETDLEDNTFIDGTITVSEFIHDIAVTDVIPQKTVVCQGYSMKINVTVANQGDLSETFNLTVYANQTEIDTKEIILTSENTTIITFTWNTSGFEKYKNYTIKAYAHPVQGETDLEDNELIDGEITVSMVGDITGPEGFPDGKVDMRDIGTAAQAFGSYPGHERWNPIADINNDNKVDMKDIGTVAKEFGKTV